MNIGQYEQVAPRTASDNVHFSVVNPGVMKVVIENVLAEAADLDAVKKGLFYGKPQDRLKVWHEYKSPMLPDRRERLVENRYLLHGVLGLVTESLELLEMVYERVIKEGEPLTREELVDETGDTMWYQNLILRFAESGFEEAAGANIAKLSKRFPAGTFSLDDWNNRDKNSEMSEVSGTLG